MLQGTCVDSEVLPTNETFLLFPAGRESGYASKSNRKSAHIGCFPKDIFTVLEEPRKEPEQEMWPPYPPVRETEIELNQVYRSRLMYHWKMCKEKIGRMFYVKAKNSLSHVYYYSDPELKILNGCLKAHWFEGFKRVDQTAVFLHQAMDVVIADEPKRTLSSEQLTLF